jgi:diketogulonate reductase-like aldo/keto reductase
MTLTRRRFGLAGAAAAVICAESTLAQPRTNPIVKLPDGSSAPALGMGSWKLAQGRHPIAEEEEAMRTGLSLGMNLIDTAEVYGGGASEQMVGRVVANQREKVFLVSKVAPTNATSANSIRQACTASLARLGTDHLDLYLLHWRGGIRDFTVVVDTFEALRNEGRIRHWGVSNFGVADMEELFRVKGGAQCAANQVVYSLSNRGIESGVLPWAVRHGVPVMAYSPLGSGNGFLGNPVLARVATRREVTPAAVAIAWTMRNGQTISIPESGSSEHIRENSAANALTLSAQDLAELDLGFPA